MIVLIAPDDVEDGAPKLLIERILPEPESADCRAGLFISMGALFIEIERSECRQ